MLSRIAEALFWIGRYVERADGTSRILDTHLQVLLEDPWTAEDLACRSLLSLMGVTDLEGPVGRNRVIAPSGVIRNFSKFHTTGPARPFLSSTRVNSEYSGCLPRPLTLILSISGKVTP